MNCSPPGSSVHGIFQARILEWVDISFSRHRLKITKCTGFQNQILWGFSAPLLDPQVEKSVVGPRTFTTVWEILWYNCSPVCGLSARLDRILRSKDITLLTKICIAKAMVFPVVMYGCELDHKESCVCAPSHFSHVWLFVTPWTVAHQAPLSKGFSRQEYWSGLAMPFSKENWAPKNWCVWTVVLEKTLENSLDCKEIKLVSSKGNQPWILIGRTDAEAEASKLWPPDAKNWLTGKDLDAGKDWSRRKRDDRGWDGWMASATQWTWLWASSRSWWWTAKPGELQSVRSQRVGHDWVIELNWKIRIIQIIRGSWKLILCNSFDNSWMQSDWYAKKRTGFLR